jgi:phosphoglycerate dehydrogenase-like enzyme
MTLALITDYMGDDTSLEEELLQNAGIDVIVSASPDPSAWLHHAERADAILTRHAPIGAEAIDRLRLCQVIARYGSGHDNVDVAAAVARGITVTNVPGYCTDEVADHALALLLACVRQIPTYSARVNSGGWTPHPLPEVRRLTGRRLALFGCGRIGAAVARRAIAFGLTVTAYDPYSATLPEMIQRADSIADLVAGAHVLSLHAPLTHETRGAIGAAELAALEPGAIVINVARGPLLDLGAALDALAADHLAGLALDVLDAEPPAPADRIRSTEGVLLTPHVAYYSTDSVADAKRRSVAEILAVIAGDPPQHPVIAAAGSS